MLKQRTKAGLNLAYDVSDEALESAAMVNEALKNYTITFCSTPWTCPMPPGASEAIHMAGVLFQSRAEEN